MCKRTLQIFNNFRNFLDVHILLMFENSKKNKNKNKN